MRRAGFIDPVGTVEREHVSVHWRGDRLVWIPEPWEQKPSDEKFSMFLLRCQNVALRLLIQESKHPDPPRPRTEPISDEDLAACLNEAYAQVQAQKKTKTLRVIDQMTQRQTELAERLLGITKKENV